MGRGARSYSQSAESVAAVAAHSRRRRDLVFDLRNSRPHTDERAAVRIFDTRSRLACGRRAGVGAPCGASGPRFAAVRALLGNTLHFSTTH